MGDIIFSAYSGRNNHSICAPRYYRIIKSMLMSGAFTLVIHSLCVRWVMRQEEVDY